MSMNKKVFLACGVAVLLLGWWLFGGQHLAIIVFSGGGSKLMNGTYVDGIHDEDRNVLPKLQDRGWRIESMEPPDNDGRRVFILRRW